MKAEILDIEEVMYNPEQMAYYRVATVHDQHQVPDNGYWIRVGVIYWLLKWAGERFIICSEVLADPDFYWAMPK